MYSRKTLREQNEKAFVEGADTGVPAQNPVDHYKCNAV